MRPSPILSDIAAAQNLVASLQAQLGAAAPAAPGVPSVISDRQFAQALAVKGVITQDEALAWVKVGQVPAAMSALLDAIQDPAQHFAVDMLLSGATQFQRHHPLTDTLAAAYGWTPDETDAFWAFAATL